MTKNISEHGMTLKGKKVLITGGLGFIGSNLAIRLTEIGADVTLVDSLVPEYGGNLFNIETIKNKIKINISDVRDSYSIERLVQDQEYLFNLAGQTSHLDSMIDPFTDLDINSKAQLSILEACRKNNPNIKIIFASTRQIYGKPEYLPVDEKHPIRPVDVNGINKNAGEQYHMLYNSIYGIRTCSLRLTNTYGPRMRIKDARQTFVGVWIKSVIQKKPFEVWGGNQLRDFTYIDDCVEAMILAATKDISNGKCYNLGGGNVLSLKELADILSSISGVNYEIKEFPADRKKIDIGDYYSNFDLIKSELKWEPITTEKSGLTKTIEYFSQNIDKYL